MGRVLSPIRTRRGALAALALVLLGGGAAAPFFGAMAAYAPGSVCAAHQWVTGLTMGSGAASAISCARPAAGDVTGLAASATTDTTNASNITSGNLATAQLSANAWTTYTPTITCFVGSVTTVTANGRYALLGNKTIAIAIEVTLTNHGSCSTLIYASLPTGVANGGINYGLIGRENAVNAHTLEGIINPNGTTVRIDYYDGTPPIADGLQLNVSGTYESN